MLSKRRNSRGAFDVKLQCDAKLAAVQILWTAKYTLNNKLNYHFVSDGNKTTINVNNNISVS